VLVVDNELWILESIVDAYEVFDAVLLRIAEMMFHDDVENLSGSFVVSRVGALSQTTAGSIQFPVDSLYDDEQETSKPEAGERQRSLDEQRPTERHFLSVQTA